MSAHTQTGATPGAWHDVMAVSEVGDDGMHAACVAGHPLVVLRADGELRAYRDACPHEGYPLSRDAQRQDFVIVCQKHLWEFDSCSGEHISRVPRPQHNLKAYPVRERDGRVEVDLSAHAAA